MLRSRFNARPIRLVLFLCVLGAATISNAVFAFAPKSVGVVTMDVRASDSQGLSNDATSAVAVTVAIHSQVAIADLRLSMTANPNVTLRQGQQQWQGAIAAGQTVSLNYVFESGADSNMVEGARLQFVLYRQQDGQSHWLGAADYPMTHQSESVQAVRVPLQTLDNNPSPRSRSTGSGADNFLIEYSLD